MSEKERYFLVLPCHHQFLESRVPLKPLPLFKDFGTTWVEGNSNLRKDWEKACQHLWSAGLSAGILPQPSQFKAAFFDMDATVIAQESIDLLARIADVEAEIVELTKKAMEGKIEFDEALEHRVRLLNGLTLGKIEQVKEQLTVNPGIRDLTGMMKAQGWETFLISGGFTHLADHIAKDLKFDGVRANQLETLNGKLSGRIVGKIINGMAKQRFAQEICQKKNWTRDQVLAIGDGANDRHLMEFVNISLGFHPKPVLFPYLNLANFTGDHKLFHSIFHRWLEL